MPIVSDRRARDLARHNSRVRWQMRVPRPIRDGSHPLLLSANPALWPGPAGYRGGPYLRGDHRVAPPLGSRRDSSEAGSWGLLGKWLGWGAPVHGYAAGVGLGLDDVHSQAVGEEGGIG